MERLWLWATSTQIAGSFRCGACHVLTDDAFSTPLGLLCTDCHRKIAETRVVKLAWDLTTDSASFTWAGIGGGSLTWNGDLWTAEGQQVDESDLVWNVAVYRWAVKHGYLGPDPFARLDYASFAVSDDEQDPTAAESIERDPDIIAA